MTNLVPQKANFSLGALTGRAREIGSGGGGGGDGRYLSINHRTGVMTVGQDATPFDLTADYAVLVEEIRYGYYIFQGDKAPDKSNMVPMVSGRPKPTPPNGYVRYPEDGARDCVEIQLHPFGGAPAVEFAPVSVSSQNRIANLVEKIAQQEMLPDGQAGFVNPVIKVKAGSYTNSYGLIYHFDFTVVDWVDGSYALRLSDFRKAQALEAPIRGQSAAMAAEEAESRKIDETLGFMQPAANRKPQADLGGASLDDLLAE